MYTIFLFTTVASAAGKGIRREDSKDTGMMDTRGTGQVQQGLRVRKRLEQRG